MKTKFKIVLNWSRLPVAAIINEARFTYTCINGNPNFPSPNPSMAAYKTGIDALESAWNGAKNGGTYKTRLMHDTKEALIGLADSLTNYISDTSGLDITKVNSSGFKVKQSGGYILASEFFAKQGKQSGQVTVKVKAKPRAIYHWQYSTDPVSAGSWLDHSMGSKSRISVTDLVPGQKYWFRVRHMDKEGAHPYTEPISIIVV